MVEGYNKDLTSSDSKLTPDRQSSELTTWIRSLQQALTVEVDHGFTNIQGRTNKFSYFVSGYLLRGPSTCLLYTSPSPRDRTRSRMPSSA